MVLQVLMRNGLSWSHTNNRMTISPTFTDGTAFRCPHILPTATCSAWLVPDLGSRSKVLNSHVLINHSGNTSQARVASTTIHTNITKFQNIGSLSHLMRVAQTSWPRTPLSGTPTKIYKAQDNCISLGLAGSRNCFTMSKLAGRGQTPSADILYPQKSLDEVPKTHISPVDD